MHGLRKKRAARPKPRIRRAAAFRLTAAAARPKLGAPPRCPLPDSRPRLVRSALLAAVVLASGAACGRSDSTAIDLLELFPFTERGQEVQVIDIGTPASEPHLVSGWTRSETLPSGESVARATARRASVRFTIRTPADGRVVVRCGVPGVEARRAVPVLVSFNRHRVGSFRLRNELAERSFRLPARFQRVGTNELVLSSPFLSHPAVQARRHVPPMTCDLIRLEGINEESAARPGIVRDTGGGALELPPGQTVDFFIRIPPASSLAFDLGSEEPVRVTAEPASGTAEVLFDGISSSPVELDLSRQAGRLARLSFAATGERPALVRSPRVLAGAPPSAPPEEGRPASTRPNILLYVVDTLRADHLGCYGYPRPTSPNVDALAAESLLFEDAIAQASWTTPSTASILTGRDPLGHGALELGQGLRQDVPTLAELLRANGYRTGGFVTNGNVSGSLGFRRGFDEYVYLPEDRTRPTVHVPADELHERVFSWLRAGDGRPFFLYVHATDPHAPYAAPQRLVDRFRPAGPLPPLATLAEPVRALQGDPALATPENVAYLTALYDAEIAFLDENLAKLIAELRTLGLYDASVVVLTADHGEELHDHGRFGHGHSLYREQTRIPLLLRLPGGAQGGQRVTAVARLIDVLPTLLGELGVAVPEGVRGRSLLALAERRDAVDEAFSDTQLGQPRRSAVVSDGWKVIEISTPRSRFEVYDLEHDPGERHDLAASASVALGYGRQRLARWGSDAPRLAYDPEKLAAIPRMDEQTRKRLQALGYVDQQRGTP